MSGHRKYPGPFPRCPAGMCAWCGLWIRDEGGAIRRDQKFCAPTCHTHYSLRANPQMMRQHIFFRDDGICAACGTRHPYLNGDWENDHIIPLMAGLTDPALFEPENCRILCKRPCHLQKTASDRRKYRVKFRRKAKAIWDEIGD